MRRLSQKIWQTFVMVTLISVVQAVSAQGIVTPVKPKPRNSQSAASSQSSILVQTVSSAPSIQSSSQISSQYAVQSSVAPVYEEVRTTTQVPEQLSIYKGDVFELIADSNFLFGSFSWTLTENETLIFASKESIFRYRFTKSGNYTLRANVYNQDVTKTISRTLYIRVKSEVRPSVQSKSTGILHSIQPKQSLQNILVRSPDIQVYEFVPTKEIAETIALDTDIFSDTDNDGDSRNDFIAQDSFFSSNKTPLFIWFATDFQKRTMEFSSGGSTTEQVTIFSAEEAKKIEVENIENIGNNSEILITRYDANTIGFGVDTSKKKWQQAPLQLHWKFGDGTQSLLDKPIHTYSDTGQMLVEVSVLNLHTGQIEEIFQKTLDVSSISSTNSSISSSLESSDQPILSSESSSIATTSSNPSNANEEGSSIVWLVIKLLFIFMGSIILGVIGIILLKIFTKKNGIEHILQRSEEILLPNSTAPEPVLSFPIVQDADESTPSTPAEVPEWLKKGTSQVIDADASTNAPVLAKENTTKLPEETVVPAWLQADTAQSPNVETSTNNSEPALPAWLQTSATEKAEPITTPAEEKPAEEIPAWLQAGLQKKKETRTDATLQTNTSLSSNSTLDSNATAPNSINHPTEQPTVTLNNEKLPDWLQPNTSSTPVATTTPNTNTVATEEVPEWLKQAADYKKNKVEKVDKKPTDDIPSWLQTSTSASENTNTLDQNTISTTSTTPVETTTSTTTQGTEPLVEVTVDSDTSTDDVTINDSDTSEDETSTDISIPSEIWQTMSEEEKERAKKRLKRKRYRQNKKERNGQLLSDIATIVSTSKASTTSADETTVPTDVTPSILHETIPPVTPTATESANSAPSTEVESDTIQFTPEVPEDTQTPTTETEAEPMMNQVANVPNQITTVNDTAAQNTPNVLQNNPYTASTTAAVPASDAHRLMDIPEAEQTPTASTEAEDVTFIVQADSLDSSNLQP